ncbi:hypothetical protein B0T26DRAFT_669459 [Lasiosphaeria miniovina]|uniref:C2H2-type domain-containing protein n=1 Tax=Lasiosphaeria miniovina TaxID=1954250 RepID=A0AA40BEY2_9PEZI|nr:uncharacterized protein B0T26DRAFT_669459 [Lasiosphaeria miniovina]KAK0733003.1 hypothetical protein B0T26DRAFT_669459 [Lasiosphaeria miniovina]
MCPSPIDLDDRDYEYKWPVNLSELSQASGMKPSITKWTPWETLDMTPEEPKGASETSGLNSTHFPVPVPERGRASTAPSPDNAGNPRGNKRRTPETAQWITLWKLRHNLCLLYKKFIDTAQASSFPNSRRLKRLYKNAAHMLQVGLSTFHGIQQGILPRTLPKVLAFVCVSAVVWSATKQKDGGQAWETPSTAFPYGAPQLPTSETGGLHKDVNSGPASTATRDVADGNLPACDFTEFDPLFMPQDSDLRNNDRLGASLFRSNTTATNTNNLDPLPDPLLDSFQFQVEHLLSEAASDDEIRFADFLNIPGLEETLPWGVPNVSAPGHRAHEGQQDFNPPGYGTAYRGQAQSETHSGMSTSPKGNNGSYCSIDTGLLGAKNSLSILGERFGKQLATTCITIFQTVLEFLCCMAGIGTVLHILSGCGTRQLQGEASPGDSSGPAGEFLSDVTRGVFEPLRQTLSDRSSELLGILGMTESMVKSGWICTLRDVESYVIQVARHLASSRDSFVSLIRATLSQCLTCSSSLTWDQTYGDGASDAEESLPTRIREKQGTLREPSTPGSLPPSPPDLMKCPHAGCTKSKRGQDPHINMRRHVRCVHETKAWKCPSCELRTGRRDNLRQHFRKKHFGQRMPEWLADKRRIGFLIRHV